MATATATIAGASNERLPVISPTMSIIARGAWAMLPKTAIIPMMTNGPGSAGKPGRSWKSRQKRAPVIPPATIPGAKMPPAAPEPTVRAAAPIRRNGSGIRSQKEKSVTCSGVNERWTQP